MATANLGSPRALALLLVASIAAALCMGAVPLSPIVVLKSLFGSGTALEETLILDLRLPRTLGAAAIGAVLGLTGALSQGLFRNPLADPSLIGVTGGALLGGALAIALGFAGSAAWNLWIPLWAFVGGLGAVSLVYGIARDASGTAVATLLLAGVAITALAGALVSLIEIAVADSTLRSLALWRLGSLAGLGYRDLMTVSGTLLILFLIALPLASFLNALLLGEAEAGHLGFTVNRLKLVLIVLIASGMAVTVALAGAIAFVGLVVPHMVRLYAGPEHTSLLPRATLLGAIVLVLGDLLSRSVLAPAEIPLGVVTALLGVPYFIFLLRRQGKRLVAT